MQIVETANKSKQENYPEILLSETESISFPLIAKDVQMLKKPGGRSLRNILEMCEMELVSKDNFGVSHGWCSIHRISHMACPAKKN